ncbi:hypothetical protein KEM52_000657, partial [Ascosphaera acerosa]
MQTSSLTRRDLASQAVAPEQHSRIHHHHNASYVEGFTRGLLGVRVSLDVLLLRTLWALLGFVCATVLAVRWIQVGHQYVRLAATAGEPLHRQRFWGKETSRTWAWLKRHVLYAPLWGKRHNRELVLSQAVNVGVVPSRVHTALIGTYLLLQVAYCSMLSYAANDAAALLAELRARAGSLALLNMVPLFVLAGRNNPLIALLHVSFDTFNLYHRWLGRIAAGEAVVHAGAWAANAVRAGGWADALRRATHVPFFLSGLVGTAAMAVLLLHSPSPVRHAFYETFLSVHQALAAAAVAGVWVHLRLDSLPQRRFFWIVPVAWACERGARVARIVYLNASRRHGWTRVTVEALPQRAARVTFHLPHRRAVPAGSHVYAYLPRFSLWMSHPFS